LERIRSHAVAIVKSGAPLGGTLFEAGSNTSGRRGRLQLGEDRPQPLTAWRTRDRIGGNHLMQQCDQDGSVGVVKVRDGGEHRRNLRRLLFPGTAIMSRVSATSTVVIASLGNHAAGGTRV
jgi:hypothetical protein